MIYLLDTNSFIEAENRHYRMPVVPGFWEWLTVPHEQITIQSITPVFEELTDNQHDPDRLSNWAKENRELFIPVTSVEIQEKFKEIANYLDSQKHYSRAKIDHFLSGADPWLIAAASIKSAKIVTHEIPVPPGSRKIKIPNIAHQYDIPCLDIFDLLELSKRTFILAN